MTSGAENVSIGHTAGSDITTGEKNVAVGEGAYSKWYNWSKQCCYRC